MKKVFIASAIAMAMSAGSAFAANQQGEIQFMGVVTDVTCDISASVDGNVSDLVQLGTVQKGQSGTVKNIVLKAKDAAVCTGLAGKTATVVFQGPLGDKGLENTKGTAQDATVELKATNGKTANQLVKKGLNSVEFDASKITTDGYKFEAKLVSDNVTGTAGTYEAAVAYAVVYN